MDSFSVERSLIRLRVREHASYISKGDTVLATGASGFIEGGEEGLFVRQTRVLSRYRILLGRRRPHPVTKSNVRQDSWMGYYIVPAPGQPVGEDSISAAAQQSLELRVSRWVGEGMREALVLANFTQKPARLRLTLDVDADFADIEETHGERQQEGKRERHWHRDDVASTLSFDYVATREVRRNGQRRRLRFDAGVALRIETSSGTPKQRGGLVHFDVELEPGAAWTADLEWSVRFGEDPLPLPARDHELDGIESERPGMEFLREATDVAALERETLCGVVDSTLSRARQDLAALRLHRFDRGPRAWTVAAGLPMYVALFGRDTLTTAQQVAMLGPELLRGTLPVMAQWQGEEDDAWRDEQPGRILHEAHPGPLSMLQYKPKDRYYGTLTGPALFCTALGHLWQWTGDREAVEPLIKPAMAALQWLDEHAFDENLGFHLVATRSRDGLKNQTWKDSDEGIVEEDGRTADHPVATCEEQGIIYAARHAMAQILECFGHDAEAKRQRAKAEALKARFDATFWMDDIGCLAMALARDGHLIRSIGSNALRCVGSGIVEDERIPRLLDRTFAPDLFSGWGIRTLSSAHPAYNPYAYHRGTVWPVEHGPFALGCYHHGAHDRVEQIARAQFEIASAFDQYRLPECFSGHPRDQAHPFPATYPSANSPQAWSASTAVTLTQTLLGIQPFAPLRLLLLDPRLPAWLPELSLRGLRIGNARVWLRFWRDPDGATQFQTQELDGDLTIVRAPTAWRDVFAPLSDVASRFT